MTVPLRSLQQMAIFITVATGGGCATMYYLMQKNFSRSDYYRVALEHLKRHSGAMESLGAPPLKVYNIHLTDGHNRVSPARAQIKIPVSGTKSAGYLYTSSSKDTLLNRWCLQEAVLLLRDGRRIDVLSSSSDEPDDAGDQDGNL
ncbi:cytochrome c oxidase assembly factor 1 homolog [Scleropages formosus]|uniref:cytochrome c oxidase assembly factor 1 homolog n=1 Tax=Scleropages formosus TaxID=113540 RepID=UPI0010FAB6D2|nr:cytochrome c oxidase assembly factor 1 homolog [Scleropages formosus]